MPKKKRPKLSFAEKLLRIKAAGIHSDTPINQGGEDTDSILSISERIQKILKILQNHPKKRSTMLYFVMYDIENNKVRTQIAKYLIKKGCVRVQKSIYLADTKRIVYEEIYRTLREVQEVYDNKDSIFLIPISTDQLNAMKIIGENIDFDTHLGNSGTLFF